MQLLLPLLLIDPQPIRRLALPLLLIDLRQVGGLLPPRVGGRGLRAALLLLHAQLQGILLLLALELVLLQRASGRILRAPGRRGQHRSGDHHQPPHNARAVHP
jgi:hypothetical protein